MKVKTLQGFNDLFRRTGDTTDWSAHYDTTYLQLLRTTDGNIYQVVVPGETGSTKPTGTSGIIIDGSTHLQLYSVDWYLPFFTPGGNGVEWFFIGWGLYMNLGRTTTGGQRMLPLIKDYLLAMFFNLCINRANSAVYAQGQKMIAGGYYWICINNGGGTSASSSPYSGTYTPNVSTVTDGSCTFMCIFTHYSTHEYCWLNVQADFHTHYFPDAHDADGAVPTQLLGLYLLYSDDVAWLNDASPHPNGSGGYWSYAVLIETVVYRNLSTQITDFMTNTFQNNISPATGLTYDVQFHEDNCNSRLAFAWMAYIYARLGDPTNQAVMLANAVYLDSGIFNQYDTDLGIWSAVNGVPASFYYSDDTQQFYPGLDCQLFAMLCESPIATSGRNQSALSWMNSIWQGWQTDIGKEPGFGVMIYAYIYVRFFGDVTTATEIIRNCEEYFGVGGPNIFEQGFLLAAKELMVPDYRVSYMDNHRVRFSGPDRRDLIIRKQQFALYYAASTQAIANDTFFHIVTVFDTGYQDDGTDLDGNSAPLWDNVNKWYKIPNGFGIRRIRLHAQLTWTAQDNTGRHMAFSKNGVLFPDETDFPGNSYMINTTVIMTIHSPPLVVKDGDYFQVQAFTSTDGDSVGALNSPNQVRNGKMTFFSLEIEK